MEHSAAANPPPKAHTQKPIGGGYAAAQTFRETKKKCRSSIKRKRQKNNGKILISQFKNYLII
jgi:hypothetical protein